MPVQASFFEPFDKTWDEVSVTMNAHLNRLAQPTERDWLGALIKGVKDERDEWLNTANLAPYLQACSRLKSRFLRLMVATYLHISYDLPRVLANHWATDPPPEVSREFIYFDLAPVFPDVLKKIVGRRKVTGIYNCILVFFSTGAVRIAVNWLMYLREAAWRHGRALSLQDAQTRTDTERRMLEAMTAALDDVSNYRPWSALLLTPPQIQAPRQFMAATGILAGGNFWLSTIAAIVAVVGFAAIVRMRKDAGELADFIDEFGRRVDWYVDLAVNNPSGFETALGGREARSRFAGLAQ